MAEAWRAVTIDGELVRSFVPSSVERRLQLETGHGSPVVFLHGGLADHRAALFRLSPLASTHRLIAPDLRASGRSHYDGELSWDRLADDVGALLSHLGIESGRRMKL